MKSSILPLAFLVFAFSSCTTAYKSGQTPDDVYFSPARSEEEYVRTETKDEYRHQSEESYDDEYLRMKVRNRYRWSDLDDPYYYRRTYAYSYSCCYCKNAWAPSTYWNYYYNPYSNTAPNSKSTVYSAPRRVNLGTYNPQPVSPNTKGYSSPKYNAPRYYSGSNNNSSPRVTTNTTDDGNSGNLLRSIINNSNSKNSSSGSNTNTSSGNSGNNSSSSSSSSSGSNAPVRKF
jgi:hypothetical protein